MCRDAGAGCAAWPHLCFFEVDRHHRDHRDHGVRHALRRGIGHLLPLRRDSEHLRADLGYPLHRPCSGGVNGRRHVGRHDDRGEVGRAGRSVACEWRVGGGIL